MGDLPPCPVRGPRLGESEEHIPQGDLVLRSPLLSIFFSITSPPLDLGVSPAGLNGFSLPLHRGLLVGSAQL